MANKTNKKVTVNWVINVAAITRSIERTVVALVFWLT